MRSITAVLGATAVTVGLIGGAAALNAGLEGSVSATVVQPITPPQASVAPKVAKEMNGPVDRVTMAGGIEMRRPEQVNRLRASGNGQGNGCVVGYGEPGQCLPLQSPMQRSMPTMKHPWACPEVRTLFPRGLEVAGRDTLGLDEDGDGVACEP